MTAEKQTTETRNRVQSVDFELSDLVFDDRGLLPVVVQEVVSGAVLMVAWADLEAIERTLETGLGHFWSRSRKSLWQKGETSGNRLRVEQILADCDRDTLLYRAHPEGPTCHLGTRSCFDSQPARLELGWLAEVVRLRRNAASNSAASNSAASDSAASDSGASTPSYTRKLLDQGIERIAQKVGEEAVEVVIAALSAPSRVASESADLLYHLLVLLESCDLDPREIADELRQRHQTTLSESKPPFRSKT